MQSFVAIEYFPHTQQNWLDASEHGKKGSKRGCAKRRWKRRKRKTLPPERRESKSAPPFLYWLERGVRATAYSVSGRKRSRWREREEREVRKRDRQVGPREELAAAMVTVTFPPRLVAMEMAAPFPSALLSLLLSFRSLTLSVPHTDRHSHTREIPSFLLSSANLLFDDKGRLAL